MSSAHSAKDPTYSRRIEQCLHQHERRVAALAALVRRGSGQVHTLSQMTGGGAIDATRLCEHAAAAIRLGEEISTGTDALTAGVEALLRMLTPAQRKSVRGRLRGGLDAFAVRHVQPLATDAQKLLGLVGQREMLAPVHDDDPFAEFIRLVDRLTQIYTGVARKSARMG